MPNNNSPHNNQGAGNNPFAQAADAYGNHAQKNTPDQREVEARVLLKAAKMIQDLRDGWDEKPDDDRSKSLEETLHYNRQIWMMFYDTALTGRKEKGASPLRDNIINLSHFIFKRESEIMSEPAKEQLDALISINKQISAGLMNSGL
jgi:flagellar biosynthesis regulator FlaF